MAEQSTQQPVFNFKDPSECDSQQLEFMKKLIAQNGKVTIMVAGRPRMGKSTALNNLFGLNLEALSGAHSVTKVVVESTTSQNGIQVRYIDTPGLEAVDDVDSKKTLEAMKLKVNTDDSNFTLLYCISVTNTFDKSDTAIVKSLNCIFGPSIWTRCILVLTRCDTLRSEDYEGESMIEDYKKCLSTYLDTFGVLLEKCNVKSKSMKLIFDCQDTEHHDDNIIIGIPAAKSIKVGKEPSILPGFDISGSLNWSDYAFLEILKKSGKLSALTLIKLRYNLIAVGLSTLGGAAAGACSGAVIGGNVGGIIGLVGGPPGVAIGYGAGTMAGTIAGVVSTLSISSIISGAVAGVRVLKKKEDEKVVF